MCQQVSVNSRWESGHNDQEDDTLTLDLSLFLQNKKKNKHRKGNQTHWDATTTNEKQQKKIREENNNYYFIYIVNCIAIIRYRF